MKPTKQDLQEQETQILPINQNSIDQNIDNKNSNTRPFARDSAVGAVGLVAGVVGSSLVSDQAFGAVSNLESNESANTEDTSPLSPNSNQVESSRPEPLNQTTSSPEEVVLTTAHDAQIANVDNSLTFGEAFADARAQVGPGGAFSYNGQMYNTYYKEEWDAMSSNQKQEYYASVDMSSGTHNDHFQSYDANESVHETSYDYSQNANSNEVYVLGVGSATIEGHEVYVAQLNTGGEDVILIDVDKNGEFDYAISDLNHDGNISSDEIADITHHHLTVPQMQEALIQNPEVFTAEANMPDYTNDADISHFS